MREVAVGAAAIMLALGLLSGTAFAVAALTVASVVTVIDNGLACTTVAEKSGPFWSGRTLGMRNTAQFMMSAAVPPVVGLIITHASYGFAFAVVAIFPLLAVGVIPVRSLSAR